jgi:hypothetical protein
MANKLVEVRAVRMICDPILKDGVLKQLADSGAALAVAEESPISGTFSLWRR